MKQMRKKTKQMCHIIAVSLMGLALTNLLPAAEEEPKKEVIVDKNSIVVRSLAFKPADKFFYRNFGGKNKLMISENAEALEKLIGKAQAEQLASKVDFEKENVVLVSWIGGSPGVLLLDSEIRGEADDRKIIFSIKTSPDVITMRPRARLAANFFAVSKGFAVSLDTKKK